MLKRGILNGTLVFMILLVFSNSVLAIGISPSREVVYFEPNLQQDLQFYVVNNVGDPIEAKVYFEGEYSYLVDLEPQSFVLDGGERKIFDYTLSHPSEFPDPGDYTIKVHADEVPQEDIVGGTFLSAVASVVSPLIIRVPYEGDYISSSLRAQSVSVGQLVPFIVKLENLGTSELSNLDIVIEIYNSANSKVGEIKYSESLNLNEIKNSEVYWDSKDMESGSYTAKLSINYGDKISEAETVFKLGEVFVDIISFQTELTADKINEYKAEIASQWSDKIEKAYVQLTIDDGEETYNFKGSNFALDPWEEGETLLYVDLNRPPAQISAGIYPATFSVYYDGFSNTKEFEIQINEPGFFDKVSPILVIGFTIMIIIIAIMFVYIVKLSKRVKE